MLFTDTVRRALLDETPSPGEVRSRKLGNLTAKLSLSVFRLVA